jgi:hypothetical protein
MRCNLNRSWPRWVRASSGAIAHLLLFADGYTAVSFSSQRPLATIFLICADVKGARSDPEKSELFTPKPFRLRRAGAGRRPVAVAAHREGELTRAGGVPTICCRRAIDISSLDRKRKAPGKELYSSDLLPEKK